MARLIKHLVLLVATGLVSAALVASPAGAAPTWRPVTNLFADLSVGGSAQSPAVGVDPAGNATAIWSRSDGTQWVVQVSTRHAGGSWSAPVDIAAGHRIHNPQLAVDPAGNVVAVWRRTDTVGSVVQAATMTSGGTWSTPVDLSADPSVDTMQKTEFPRVAVDATGAATATWSRYDGKSYVVQAATLAPGGTWTAAVDVSTPGQSARTPELAVDPAGNATLVWVAAGVVQSAARPAGGTWSAPVNLSAASLMTSNPQVVADPSGTAIAVWHRLDTGAYVVESASRPIGGTWTAPVRLSAPGVDTFSTPQVGVGPRGATVAVWQRHDGSSWVVAAATRTAGGGWTPSVDVSESGRDAWDPQVAVDSAGNATAVWSATVPDSWQRVVQGARLGGGVWSAPTDLSPAGGNAWNPQVAIDPAGNATTTWSRHDGTTWVVQSRGLDAAGPVVTDLTARAIGSGGKRAYSVTAHDVWSTVASATWDFGDGTTATGMSVTHAARAGTRRVKVTLTDAVGNATLCTYTRTYTCTTDLVAPVVTEASLTSRRIRGVGSDSDAPWKTEVAVVLATAAEVSLVLRRAGARETIRLTDRREAGQSAFAIRARLAKHQTLSPGRWTITITATNEVGTSKRKRLRLRVV